MYPQVSAAGLGALPDEYCAACHLRKLACCCRAFARLPVATTLGQFFLLAHPREITRPTNTGHLLLRALAGTAYAPWSRVERAAELEELSRDAACQLFLVFPASDTPVQTVTADAQALAQFCGEGRRPVFILLDATWQEAGKMLRQSPYLQQLPRMTLKAACESRYDLRRNQQPGHLSTLEVAAELLRQLGDEQQGELLQDYYRVFLHHYRASASNHKPAEY